MIQINYIKASFQTSKPSSDFLKQNFHSFPNVKTACFEEFLNITVTLMRADFTFVNVTGAKSLNSLRKFKIYYLNISRVKQITDIKIDSISSSYRFDKKCCLKLSVFRQNLYKKNLNVKDNSKFPGITICNNAKAGRSCAIYFRSGAVNFLGFKHIEDVIRMKNLIEECLYTEV